jgi:redox-sensitive bicupin YhaK (pirin superfamily)
MITIRAAQDRGGADLGWLDTKHTFSFDRYYDPAFMGFSSLRVINEDKVKPGNGFPKHGHRDMEIISYVINGELEHKDSLGTGSIIRPGDVQRMSAGTGILHSEFNPSRTEPVHFLQIWILPKEKDLEPSYEQKYFPSEEKEGKLCLIASPDGRQGSVTIHQDVDLYAVLLRAGEKISHLLAEGHKGWIQVARGSIELNGSSLGQGDGAALSQESTITIEGTSALAEVLLFDLAQ